MSGVDKREQILSRIHELLDSLQEDGVVNTVVRNRGELTAEDRPAIELWDADEEFDPDYTNKGRHRPAFAPTYMLMTPKIYLFESTLDYTVVGPKLNALRAQVLKAILTDTDLKQQCEDIFLARSFPDLDRGLTQKGEMLVSIVFQYVLRPDQL